ILTYGGVSFFVVVFAIYPIAGGLFQAADITKRLVPAAIALGSFTFTMTALAGPPAIQNAIPIPYYGTNVFAAPGLGIIAGVIMFAGGIWWLHRQAERARLAGEGYGQHSEEDTTPAASGAESEGALSEMPLILALLPLV